MDALEDYARRWIKVLNVLFYANILQCFLVVENFTANAVSVAIGDNGNRLIFEYGYSGRKIGYVLIEFGSNITRRTSTVDFHNAF
jgi:hypothetical protein